MFSWRDFPIFQNQKEQTGFSFFGYLTPPSIVRVFRTMRELPEDPQDRQGYQGYDQSGKTRFYVMKPSPDDGLHNLLEADFFVFHQGLPWPFEDKFQYTVADFFFADAGTLGNNNFSHYRSILYRC